MWSSSGVQPGLPKYARIVNELQRRIRDGRYAPGALMPSESEMVEEFGASRATVVRALNLLQERGWITREHGVGTYAAVPPETLTGRVQALEAQVQDLTKRLEELQRDRGGPR